MVFNNAYVTFQKIDNISTSEQNYTLHHIEAKKANISEGFSSDGVWKIEVSFVFIAATSSRNVLTQKMKTWSCLLEAGQQVRFTN